MENVLVVMDMDGQQGIEEIVHSALAFCKEHV